jgi:NAD(P)-dependent dehydrogenase (short-subunit alcohol dehydrogenase family)
MRTGDGPALVLVSGGARGITARCVVELAGRYGWRFLLLGRTPTEEPPPSWADAVMAEAELKRRLAADLAADSEHQGTAVRPAEIQRRYERVRAQLEIGATLRAVAEAGGQAEYVRLDVAEGMLRERLAPAIARHGGTVTGIVHGAGALADRSLEDKRAADFDRVFAPKARGLRELLDAVDPAALRFLVLFSSAAGYYGHAGQADYALANEVLNKAAYRLRARLPGCRVVAFDWGPWDGGAGMVTPELKRHFAARGVELVPPDAGARVVSDALAPDAAPPPQLLVGSPLPSAPARLESPARGHRIVRRLGDASNPFLRDHVIGGRPVLPVTCAMAWIADACESRYPGLHAVRLEDCHVLGGVVIDEDEEAELALELTESAGPAEGGELRIRAEISRPGTGARPRPHYRADVVLARERPQALPNGRPPGRAAAAPAEEDGASLYLDGTLFHGPAFQGVRRVLSLDAGGLELECRLPQVPERVQGQFRAGSVNPYVADALFQGVVVWARRTHGVASLPVRTVAAELHRPLEFDHDYTVSVAVRESAPHRLVADIDAADADGAVCLRLLGAEVTLSPTLSRLFVPAGAVVTGAA